MFSTGRDFRPHGIPVAAPTCGRWVRGGEPDERVKNGAKTQMQNSTPEERGALTRRPGRRCCGCREGEARGVRERRKGPAGGHNSVNYIRAAAAKQWNPAMSVDIIGVRKLIMSIAVCD